MLWFFPLYVYFLMDYLLCIFRYIKLYSVILLLNSCALNYGISSNVKIHFSSQNQINQTQIKNNTILAQVANTDASRQQGLMNIKNLDKDNGMLFVFDSVDIHCFWMKNTFIPLSIAFIDEKKSIIDMYDMKPQDETPICPKKPSLYALEVNQGWFMQHNIATDSKLLF
jgi:uncharacterized membrane protein (UPF0127 family)